MTASFSEIIIEQRTMAQIGYFKVDHLIIIHIAQCPPRDDNDKTGTYLAGNAATFRFFLSVPHARPQSVWQPVTRVFLK